MAGHSLDRQARYQTPGIDMGKPSAILLIAMWVGSLGRSGISGIHLH